MTGSRILVVGDVINDVLVVPRGEIRRDTDTSSTIRQRPGGSAANTAAWLGSLGVPVDFVGCVGADDAERHEREFRNHGVEPHLQVEPGLPTGTIVIVVEGERRTMLTERGANSALRSTSVADELLADAGLLLISVYTILDSFATRGGAELLARARAAEVPVVVAGGSAGYLADFGAQRFLELVDGAALAFLNIEEARLLTGADSADRAALKLLDSFEAVSITLGSEGAVVAERGYPAARIPAPPARMVDPTGAGDAFTAGFLARWRESRDLVPAGEAGAFVAARAVMVMGGRPPV